MVVVALVVALIVAAAVVTVAFDAGKERGAGARSRIIVPMKASRIRVDVPSHNHLTTIPLLTLLSIVANIQMSEGSQYTKTGAPWMRKFCRRGVLRLEEDCSEVGSSTSRFRFSMVVD